jgi:hypothetical protein
MLQKIIFILVFFTSLTYTLSFVSNMRLNNYIQF